MELMMKTANDSSEVSLSYCIANYAVTLDILALLVRKNYLTRDDALESVQRARKLAKLSNGFPGEQDFLVAVKECMEVIDQVFSADTADLSGSKEVAHAGVVQ
jgi:hypothetical protein